MEFIVKKRFSEFDIVVQYKKKTLEKLKNMEASEFDNREISQYGHETALIPDLNKRSKGVL